MASATGKSTGMATGKATTPAATEATIAANWTAFFNPKLSITARTALLQDGPQFAAPIKSQASSSTAQQTSAKVTAVKLLTATTAKVTYDILLSGTPALTNQTGTAVLDMGTWKISAGVYCGLLTLESYKPMPALCSSAG
jgi:hypothetical protein